MVYVTPVQNTRARVSPAPAQQQALFSFLSALHCGGGGGGGGGVGGESPPTIGCGYLDC